MNREQVKKLLPILQAFAEGKTIEIRTNPKSIANHSMPNDWVVMDELECWANTEYRIKPTSIYRPFANAKECWQEMLKHQPFGWIKTEDGDYYPISSVDSGDDFNSSFNNFRFADGSVFGIKESED